MRFWLGTVLSLGLVFLCACVDANNATKEGGSAGAGMAGLPGVAGIGASGVGGSGELGGTGAEANLTGGGGVSGSDSSWTAGTGGTGATGVAGTQDVVVGGQPADVDSQDDGTVVQTGGTGGSDAPLTGGAGAAGAAGVDGDPFVRDQDPTSASATADGPYTVQSYSSGFSIGPDFPGGTIWYPTDAEPPFASIAIVPGFVSPRVLIEGWGPFLASHGIVVFTIDTNAVSDQPTQRSRALLNALDSLKAENTRAGSPLNGKLDNDRQAVGGHSMGGGGTLITANGNPHLKAALPMCPWNPGGTFSRNQVPTLIFASAGDPLAGGQSQGFYSSIPDSTPKMLFEWGAADHFMANAPTGAAGQVGRYGLSWLKVFLEGDERYRQFIEQPCDGCTDFRSNL
jgi:dienelactone hydrolase